ncbi:hypothetical protein N8T08_000814 [Aspergillus melleus]|uniref:Uncharacterized protein n=1 Tax=Aspergillus melleus TaxID=138277 RepID=A0ACC3APR4_9EURO|nr:hypothetical protein N8T08_000814 [Aspergillus melleus]
MMEVVLDNMDQIGKLSTDALSAQSASLLRRLLAVEAKAAAGNAYTTHRPTHMSDHALSQQYQHPALTADAEDWAFQGVDMAFFSNLV